MNRSALFALLCAIVLAACSASVQKTTPKPLAGNDSGLHAPAKPSYTAGISFFYSSSGNKAGFADVIVVDSMLNMKFVSRTKGKDGNWHELQGIAVLEPRDLYFLNQIVDHGKLLDIDPTDLAGNCSDGEYYSLLLSSFGHPKGVRLTYSTCTLDYNTLPEPERSGFVQLNVWFDSLRVKYRPKLPD